jgi:hypothetical protein
MGLIMMELAPSTPAAKAAAVPLGRLLTPWGSHRVAYDVNRLVTCAKRAVIIRIGNGQRRRTLAIDLRCSCGGLEGEADATAPRLQLRDGALPCNRQVAAGGDARPAGLLGVGPDLVPVTFPLQIYPGCATRRSRCCQRRGDGGTPVVQLLSPREPLPPAARCPQLHTAMPRWSPPGASHIAANAGDQEQRAA